MTSERDGTDLERALELIHTRILDQDLGDADREALIGLAGLVAQGDPHSPSSARRRLIERIEHAITGRRFRIVYQPIVDLTSGETVGFEALSRFGQPDPSKWFADASDVGIRVALELFAIGEALHGGESKVLPPGGFISVNASPSALMSPRLTFTLKQADLSRLVIELTEDAPIDEPDDLLAVLRPLRQQGLRLAIDDTGAGYSSLKVIHQLKPDFIKFDRYFVTGIESDPARRAIFAASVDFARALGARLVAEGVETTEQLQILKQLGVHLAQGFLLGRPSE